MKLPVYELMISDDFSDDAEVNFVALVDKPAVQRNWNAFKEKVNFQIISEDKRIISGLLMLSDTPIFRSDAANGDYYVTFSKDTIFKIAQRFFKKGYQANVNLMHDASMQVDGVTMFESFISDKSRGIAPMKGFEDAPDGSWFGSFKVDNEKVWKMIKEGKVMGFSVEGIFEYQKINSRDEQLMRQIKQILSEIDFGGPGSGRLPEGKATAANEVKSGNPKLNDLIAKAKEAAPEIDKIARDIAEKYQADITPINLKSEGSIIRKVNSEEKGDLAQIKDSVRTTIISDDKASIDKIINDISQNPSFVKAKSQTADTNSLGYSGNIVNIKGSNGVLAEIQVNTSKMIYAKEKPEDAIRAIGKEKYDQIAKQSGIEGGKGHAIYEEYRVLKPSKDKKRMTQLENESKNYYKNFLD